jgi:hypothetical protein
LCDGIPHADRLVGPRGCDDVVAESKLARSGTGAAEARQQATLRVEVMDEWRGAAHGPDVAVLADSQVADPIQRLGRIEGTRGRQLNRARRCAVIGAARTDPDHEAGCGDDGLDTPPAATTHCMTLL